MQRSNKMVVTLIAATGISLMALSQVSANDRHSRCGYDQGQMGGYYGKKAHGERPGFDRDAGDNRSAWMEQRLDMMKYQLRISETQEPVWRAFEETMKQTIATRKEQRQAARDASTTMTISERVTQMRGKAGQIMEVANAMEQLYGSLTPEQQKIADEMRPMRGMARMR